MKLKLTMLTYMETTRKTEIRPTIEMTTETSIKMKAAEIIGRLIGNSIENLKAMT